VGGRADQPPGARDPDNTDAKNLAGDLTAVQALLGHLDTFELGIPIVTP